MSFDDLIRVCSKAEIQMRSNAKRCSSQAVVDVTGLRYAKGDVVKNQIKAYFAKRGLVVNVRQSERVNEHNIILTWVYVVPHVYNFE